MIHPHNNMNINPYYNKKEVTMNNILATLIKEDLIRLLQILNTDSPKKQLEAIQIFFLKEKDRFTSDEINSVLELYMKKLEHKREVGLENSKKMVMKNPVFKKDYQDPGFPVKCQSCSNIIVLPGPCFFQKTSGKFSNYHALPECFPKEHAIVMSKQRNYIDFMKII
jgi:hypothetical protein